MNYLIWEKENISAYLQKKKKKPIYMATTRKN